VFSTRQYCHETRFKLAPGSSPICGALQSDVLVERQKLQNDVTLVKWYPVISLSLAYRF
jgi:hypothetical protein